MGLINTHPSGDAVVSDRVIAAAVAVSSRRQQHSKWACSKSGRQAAKQQHRRQHIGNNCETGWVIKGPTQPAAAVQALHRRPPEAAAAPSTDLALLLRNTGGIVRCCQPNAGKTYTAATDGGAHTPNA